MKRFFALFLAIIMIMGVFAGCNKTTNDDIENVTTTTVPVDKTEPNQEPSGEPTVDASHQQIWEDIILNEKYKFASNSYKMISEFLSIVYLTDGTARYFKMEGDLEEGKLGAGLAAMDAENIYYEQVINGVTTWFKCTNLDSENVNIDTTFDDAKRDNNKFEDALAIVSNVEYVESIGDIDKVIGYYAPIALPVNGVETIYDVTFEIEYNGKKGTYRYTETAEDGVISSSAVSSDPIDDFNWNDWEFEKETLSLVKGEESIECVIVEDHYFGQERELVPIEIYINSKTFEITKMVMDVTETSLSMIEYVHCENVATVVNIPESCKETELENALMEFAFTMLGIAFSGISN